jgi:hypothetical protein
MSMKILTLNLKKEWFDDIKSGKKKFEYREYKPYWIKRLEGKNFDKIKICLGYPKADDREKIIQRPWKGYQIDDIKHPIFDDKLKKVFAIIVN